MFRTLILRAGAAAAKEAPRASLRTKQTTGIVGVPVHPEPFKALSSIYKDTLAAIAAIPPNSVYRQSVEALTQHRLGLVQKAGEEADEAAIAAVEAEIDQGNIENVIAIAQDELKLVAQMKEWQAWDELEHKAPAGQWDYFDTPPSTTMPSS